MEESIVTDLISLLRYGHSGGLSRRDAKPEVRQQAAEYMCSLTSSKDGCEMIAKQQGHLALAKLLGDSIVFLLLCPYGVGDEQICHHRLD